MSQSEEAMARIMAKIAEDRETEAKVRKHKWERKSNRQKTEALLSRVNPAFVRESDLPVLALAQVHATLALLDFNRGVPEGITNYERVN